MICRHYQITWGTQRDAELDQAARQDLHQTLFYLAVFVGLPLLGWLLHAAYLALQASP